MTLEDGQHVIALFQPAADLGLLIFRQAGDEIGIGIIGDLGLVLLGSLFSFGASVISSGIVAAVHAGWRGVLAGIVPNAIAAMTHLGAREIRAAIGPCIRVDAFEVGEDVAQQFADAFAPAPVVQRRDTWPKPHVDVVAAITAQLHAAGIAHINIVGECSFARSDLYFSHRRDGSRSGRMAAFIGPRASA